MAYVWIALSAALWGITGIFTKHITSLGFTPLEMSLDRSFFAVVLLGGLFLRQDKNLFRLESKKELKQFFLMSIFGYCCYNVSYVMAVNEIGVGVAGALFYTYPAFALLQSKVILGESITAKKVGVILITFLGCVCVSGLLDGGIVSYHTKGILLGVLSGFSFALYSVLSKKSLGKYHSKTVTFYTFLTSLVVFFFIGSPIQTTTKIIETNAFFYMIFFALCISVLPYLLYLKGLTKIDVGKATVITTVEPLVAAFVGIVIYGEELTFVKITGILLIVGAVCFIVK